MTNVSSVGSTQQQTGSAEAAVLASARQINTIGYVNTYAARNFLGQDDKAAKTEYRRRMMALHPDRLPQGLTPAEREECANAVAKLGDLHVAIFPKPTNELDKSPSSAVANSTPASSDTWQDTITRLATELGGTVSAKAQELGGTVTAKASEILADESVKAALGKAQVLGQAAAIGAATLFARVRQSIQSSKTDKN